VVGQVDVRQGLAVGALAGVGVPEVVQKREVDDVIRVVAVVVQILLPAGGVGVAVGDAVLTPGVVDCGVVRVGGWMEV